MRMAAPHPYVVPFNPVFGSTESTLNATGGRPRATACSSRNPTSCAMSLSSKPRSHAGRQEGHDIVGVVSWFMDRHKLIKAPPIRADAASNG